MHAHIKSRVLTILERHSDTLCRSSYTIEDENKERHCLLGWLAVEAGVPLPEGDFNSHVLGMEGTMEFASALQEKYDLSFKTLKAIQFANDDLYNDQELLERVQSILEDAEGPDSEAA